MSVLEGFWVGMGSGLYAVGAGLAWRRALRWTGLILFLGAAAIGAAIAARWQATGQGPFLSLYEILMSSLFSLGMVAGVAGMLSPQVRSGSFFVTCVLLLLAGWLWISDAGFKPLPATYGNPWLWVHVLAGKLFLGSSLVAASLAAAASLPEARGATVRPATDALAWRWLAFALFFHTVMLVAGAVWAQDAWGRYWDWDPLETWSFGTWLAMVGAFHVRVAWRVPPALARSMVIGIFVLAFLTFFGVPFVSLAPHKGAV